MAASASVVVTLKTLFSVLACVMIATLLWGIAIDGLASCGDPHARWLTVALINFYINLAFIVASIYYKESSWIRAAIITILAIVLGSIITFGYIVIQLFKLSPEESSKDPLYFVLVSHQNRDAVGHKWGPSIVTSRVITSLLGCFMVVTLIYILIVDGSPFHAQIFSTCMIATQTDFFFNVLILSVWVAYKESSWISAFLWILSLVCFGSIGTCAYIVRQLFYVSIQQDVSLVLFNKSDRVLLLGDPLLVAHTNV